jgi:hypothetical protein
VAGGWRRLHNKELHNMYASPNIKVIKSRSMSFKCHVARMGEMRSAYNILVGKPERKRPLGKPGRRWKDNIRMDLSEIRREIVNCIHLAQQRDQWRALVNTVMNLRAP